MQHCCERVACDSNRVIIERPRVPRRQVVHYFSHELLLLLDWQRLELGEQFCCSSAHSGKGILHQINRRENRSSLRSLYNNDHLLCIVSGLRCISPRVVEAVGAAAARLPYAARPYSASRILDTIENPRRSRGGAADFPARTRIPIAKTAKRLA